MWGKIILSYVLNHYYSQQHEYYGVPENYLGYSASKNMFTCNFCLNNNKQNFVHFNEHNYAKAFRHMYKVHKLIMFPFLNEYNKSNRIIKAKIIQKRKNQKISPDSTNKTNPVTEGPMDNLENYTNTYDPSNPDLLNLSVIDRRKYNETEPTLKPKTRLKLTMKKENHSKNDIEESSLPRGKMQNLCANI